MSSQHARSDFDNPDDGPVLDGIDGPVPDDGFSSSDGSSIDSGGSDSSSSPCGESFEDDVEQDIHLFNDSLACAKGIGSLEAEMDRPHYIFEDWNVPAFDCRFPLTG